MSTPFYRVTLKTRQLVSVIKGTGKNQTIDRTEKLIEQTYGGLPYSTALAYQQASPGAVIEIDDTWSRYDTKPKARVTDTSRRPAPAKLGTPAKAPKKPAPAPEPVLGGGDYATLVNKLAGAA